MTRTYTVDDIMGLGPAGPCEDYPRERVAELWGDRPALTVAEIGDLDIPEDDRLWALVHLMDSDVTRRLWACDVAEAALGLAESPDPRSVAAIDVSRRFARGEATREELDAARSAARSAAWGARGARGAWSAWSAARSAAWDAAWGARDACSAILASAVRVVDAGQYVETEINLTGDGR